MKRLALVTTSLIVALLSFGGASAFAEENEKTYYPEDAEFIRTLEFPQLSDYCIDGDTYYFADGKTLNVFDGTQLTPYAHNATITGLGLSEEVYFRDSEAVYVLKQENGVLKAETTDKQYSFESSNVLTVSGGIYRLNGGRLDYCANDASSFTPIEGTFANLKQYGQAVYAVSDNCLYKITGDAAEKLSFDFFYDCAKENGVIVGDTALRLKQNYSLKFVTVKADAYMTKVDVETIGDEKLTLGETLRTEEKLALLLCYTGNAAIITMGADSYILNKENVTETAVNCYVENDYENATITSGRIYASPYVAIGTAAVADTTDMIVAVINKLELEGVLEKAFYEVVYMTDSGSTKVGYVADGYLTPHIIEDNKEPEKVVDKDYSEKSDTRTILLIFAVVVLVLIAIGYLAYAGTSDKRKNKKDKKETEKDK